MVDGCGERDRSVGGGDLSPLEGAACGLGFRVETIEFCFNLFCSCMVISRSVLQNPSVFLSQNDDACGVTEERLRGTGKEDRLGGIVGRRDAQKVRCRVSCERWAIKSNCGRQRDSAATESSGQISAGVFCSLFRFIGGSIISRS